MVRISKQSEKRQRSPRKHRHPSLKTGSVKEAVSFKRHANAIKGESSHLAFIPKIK